MSSREGKDHFLAEFERYQNNGGGRGPSWLSKLREAAMARFKSLGFPTTRNEDWKYTSVEPIASLTFGRGKSATRPVSSDEILSLSFAPQVSNRLVFVNGTFSPPHSSLREIPTGARLLSLAEALKEPEGYLQTYLARYASYQEEAFVALNTAFIEDGAIVFIPEGQTMDEPIWLIFVSGADEDPLVSHPRNLIVLENGSQACVVETYIGFGNQTYLANGVTEIIGGENTSIDYYRLERGGESGFHIGAVEARLMRNCNFTAHSIALGGSLIRNDAHAVVDGEGVECVLNGLYLVDGKQHVDNHTRIDHVQPRARSLELYKGILSGQARGVFNGKIFVHKAAQKTDARQTNKNLVLSKDAVVNTKPQLEINADDVKCSHGSTIGQLDRDALFYLRSRGLDLENAQSLLSYAFASDVVNRVKIAPMRARLDDYLLTKFARN